MALTALWGKSSWFGGPNDKSSGPTTASGAPVSVPGIAVYNRATLGGYWAIKAPNGTIGIVKQTDIGPAPSTGRKFDYTSTLLPLFGYSQNNFPTGGQTFGYFLGDVKTLGGPGFQTALSRLGATPEQQASLIQSIDTGALEQGQSAVTAPLHQKPGTTIAAAGQTPSGSEAVPAGPDLSGIGAGISSAITDVFNQAVSDAKFAAVTVAVLVVGVILISRAFSGGGSSEKVKVIPV
jgi:hypothetical protein